MPDPYQCIQAPIVTDFCSYIAEACAAHQIASAYCDILADKCDDPITCSTCFYLENTCHQIGVNCENLGYECACVAEMDNHAAETTGEEPPPGDCGDPGSLFGPCIEGIGCLGNFGCFSRQDGQVCIPTFNYAVTHGDEIDNCVRKIGGNLVCGSKDIIDGWCVVACDDTCAPGLNCDDGDAQIIGDNVCVHPW